MADRHKSKKLIRLTEAQHAALKGMADRAGVPMVELLDRAIRWLARAEARKEAPAR